MSSPSDGVGFDGVLLLLSLPVHLPALRFALRARFAC